MTERENNQKSNATSVTGELLTLFFDQVTGNFNALKGGWNKAELWSVPQSSLLCSTGSS